MTLGAKSTPYGKYLKKIRIDRDETIAVMAKHLEVSPSYLASIETGSREIPAGFSSKLVGIYKLNEVEVEELVLAESRTPHKTIAFDTNTLHNNPLSIHTAVYLTCMLPYLDKAEVEELCGKLKGFMAVKHGRVQTLSAATPEEVDQAYSALQKQLKDIQSEMAEIGRVCTDMKKHRNKADKKSKAKAGEEK
jgi:HTH-type transcriptional regulator, competence development regulator